MRSPWIDLLFLHGYITPTQANQLAWRPDARRNDDRTHAVTVDVGELPLRRSPENDITCCS